MPKMFRRLIFSYSSVAIQLLYLMVCCINGVVRVQAVDPFTGTTESSSTWEDLANADCTVNSLSAPSLVELSGNVLAVTETHVKKADVNSFTGIASQVLDNDVMEISTNSPILDRKALKKVGSSDRKAQDVMRPTTLVNDNNVYMLLGSYSQSTSSPSGAGNWALMIAKGNVNEEGGRKKIKWTETKELTPEPAQLNQKELKHLVGSGGSGVVMEDKTLVFPMQATDGQGKFVPLVMQLSGSAQKWKVTKMNSAEDCSDPAIAEWTEGKIYLITACAKGFYEAYESINKGESWYSEGESITRVWGSSLKRQGKGVRTGFIAATIDGKKVMLLSLPTYTATADGKEKGKLHLWVSDNIHVYDVGQISTGDDDVAASNLLYTNDNQLISLYEKKGSDGSTVTSLVSVRLTEQLKQIKTVVKTWEDTNNLLKRCSSKGHMCNGPVPTEGLVGFLSDTLTDNVWKDEYLCVNATVKGATKTSKGLKFQGSDAGAEWPVGKLGQNQPYYFANNEFTLVATVTIHHVPTADSKPIPLIGVKMNDAANTVLFGLSYSHDNKWVPVFNNEKRESVGEEAWESSKEYQVALTMKGSEWSIYIDGKEINEEEDDDEGKVENLFESHGISHFYIGGDGANAAEVNRHVTVTNVMLYYKVLGIDDINKLFRSMVKITPPAVDVEPQPESQPQPQPAPISPPSPLPPSPLSPSPPQPEKPPVDADTEPNQGGSGVTGDTESLSDKPIPGNNTGNDEPDNAVPPSPDGGMGLPDIDSGLNGAVNTPQPNPPSPPQPEKPPVDADTEPNQGGSGVTGDTESLSDKPIPGNNTGNDEPDNAVPPFPDGGMGLPDIDSGLNGAVNTPQPNPPSPPHLPTENGAGRATRGKRDGTVHKSLSYGLLLLLLMVGFLDFSAFW